MKKTIVIDNPSDLPLLPMESLQLFQGDLKAEPEPNALEKLMRSIVDHHLFIAKAIFYEGGDAYTEDGHQTLKALTRLKEIGYKTCEVISYSMQDGRMQEVARKQYDSIMIPCQVIVPKGDTPESRRKDAAVKLLQINSEYAKINPQTSFFDSLGFSFDDLDSLLTQIEFPALNDILHDDAADFQETDPFQEEFLSHTDETCLYPIVPKFSEKYDAILIVSDNEIDTTFLESALQIQQEQSYKSKKLGKGMVLTAKRFQELWKSRL